MGFTDFKGIQEMGIICGGGLLVCFIPMMTMLPAMLLARAAERSGPGAGGHRGPAGADREPVAATAGLVVGITLALCGLAATQIGKVYFDYNLLNMQSAGLPAVEFEKDLISAANAPNQTNSSPKSVLYAAVVATNLQQAVALEQQLTNLPAVASVESMSKYLAEDPTRKLALIAELKRELCSVHFDEADTRPVDLSDLSRALYSTFGYLGHGG